jgi:23S rRNA (cytidine1920-2'-O)/16S rRNA (cytidine1409-2'-O)-methyltransferase
MRVDQLLVQQGLAPSRSAARRLLESGAVRWLGPSGWAVAGKAGEDLPEDCRVEITDDAEVRYVSRGGLKLAAALEVCRIDVRGAVCLDVGQGSGGFTDVLLRNGAARVIGVDVGHGQLHPSLRADARVTALEGINARHLQASDLPETRVDLVTGDLSFISLTHVLPALTQLGAAQLLLLVKPQFELQPADIGKGGLVRDAAALGRVEQRIRSACAATRLEVTHWFESAIAGGDGNREFFVRAVHAKQRTASEPRHPQS